MTVGQVIKYKHPVDEAEAKARFVVVEDNGDRGFARLICELNIPPIVLVRVDEVESADEVPTKQPV